MQSVARYGKPLWVIGSPVEHTLSPPLHNAAFEADGLPHRYFALDVKEKDLESFLDLFRQVEGLGANLTLPLKRNVLDRVERKSRAVRATGAANTIFWSEGRLKLANSDVYGFKQLVAPWQKRIRKEPVLILGAGGAARACLQGLIELQTEKIVLWNRTKSKARQLKETFEFPSLRLLDDQELQSGNFTAGLVVNATSLGLNENDPSPFPPGRIQPGMVGVDLIYGRKTEFITSFRNQGKDAVGGMTMLIEQAAKAWELWVGKEPNRRAMQEAVDSIRLG